MNDLAVDSAIDSVADGQYSANLSAAWSAFGLHGGYLAAVAVRAAGACASFPRPASVSCHFLLPPQPGKVELQVTPLSRTPRAEAQRVTMRQHGRDVLSMEVWTVSGRLPGPTHNWSTPPAVPHWEEVPTLERTGAWKGVPLWDNLEIRDATPAPALGAPTPPINCGWARLRARSRFGDDLWLHVARLLVMVDHCQFPAISRSLAELTFVAPTLHLHTSFHAFAPDDEWLLARGHGQAAGGGLIGSDVQIWSASGTLLATSTQQMLFTLMRAR